MKQTVGRFLLQPDKDFPIDCETLDYMQTNVAMVSILGNIAGDKAILQGCELEQNDTRRKVGYVFLKTKDYPEGELLYWEGGNVSGGMYIKQEVISVAAQGYEYPQAYVVRSLAAGIGSENYSWNDFKAIKTAQELDEYNKTQDATVATLAPPPLGIVQMWAGSKVPSGYELCEGQQLRISDYPALYNALGATFNNAYAYNGSRYSTTSGYFRLPDLRGRFVVGYNPSDGDYDAYGKAGGEKKHALTVGEMPSHSHTYQLYKVGNGDRSRYSYKSNSDSDTNDTLNSSSVGGNSAHENRPPYYTLAYIMQLK